MEWDLCAVLLIAGAVIVSWYLKRRNGGPLSHLPLPPGPKGLPFIGNLRDMPTSLEWMTYHKWSKEFDFDNEDNLPYITAIAKETLRWREVAPIAIPRYLAVDDYHKGYRLPAGSIVIANAWAMLHDEEVYPDPFTFNPDRFIKDGKLDKSVRDPSHACWDLGDGRYMAFSALWIAIASLITVFDIDKAVDEDGNVNEPSHEYISGLLYVPKPFKCAIRPRSKEAKTVIRLSASQDAL